MAKIVESVLRLFIKYGEHGAYDEVDSDDVEQAWHECGCPERDESGAFRGIDKDSGVPVHVYVGSKKPKSAHAEED